MADNAPSRRLMLRLAAAVPLLPVNLARGAEALHTLRPGVLRIGTYFVNPPFEFISGHARVGFEVDLMTEVAARLGLHPVFVNTRWEVILHEMQENRYDCIIGGITITPDRERLLAWSVPYMTTTLSLIVDAARSPAGMTFSDLQGATVGVQAATTDYDAAVAMHRRGAIGHVKVYPFARIADAMTDLSSGHIGAVMKVFPVAAWLVRQSPGLRILGQVPDDPQPLGVGFAESNRSLAGAVDHALSGIHSDGGYEALLRRWRITQA